MIKLSSTSAFVLLLTDGEIHKSNIAKKFLSLLDLELGRDLLIKCTQFWPHYGEVAKNRKSCILNLAKNIISKDKITQIIIFGAGLDALSLEICSFSKRCKVFEIDIANMKTKNKLIRSTEPSLVDYIKCIGMDITRSKNIIKNLSKHGWNDNVPSLIIFEGISYYLSETTLWEIVENFKTKDHRNRMVLEYLLPHDKISKEWLQIAESPFNLIATNANLARITRYTINNIIRHVKKLNGHILQRYKMKQMEKDRTLQNTFFKTEQSGWIEICEISI